MGTHFLPCPRQVAGQARRFNAMAGRCVALALLAVFFWDVSGNVAFGQAQNTGGIVGNVTDSSGAVVTGATVKAEEPDKGIVRTTKSSSSGEFTLTSLPVGTYTLTVTSKGFETYQAASILIDADKSVKIVAKLKTGSESVTVSVDAGGATVDTNSATIATLIDTKLIQELPIDGNNIVALAGLLPGVTDLNAPTTNTSDRAGPTYSVSGSRNTQNLMLFDGLMWNNLFYNTGVNYPPPPALQEVSVQLNNFKAQYGRNAGSVFNVLTKSGGNQIHGQVWDYIQNKAFNAADYLSHRNPKDNSNQLGASVTGPIIRDKLYFAITFQDLIQRLQAIGTAEFIAGYAERGLNLDGSPYMCSTTGPFPGMQCLNFAEDVKGQGGYQALDNPEFPSATEGVTSTDTNNMLNSAWAQAGNTGQHPCIALLNQASVYASTHPYLNGTTNSGYMPNAEFPAVCGNPVMANFFKHYAPLPNTPVTDAFGDPENEAITAAPQPRNDQNFTARADWIVNSRHNIDLRYNLIAANDATAPGVNSSSVGVATYELSANNAVSNFGNIGDRWILSPNVLNTIRVGYKRYVYRTPPIDHNTWNTFGGNFVEPGVPVMPVIGITNSVSFGSTSQANSSQINEDIEVLDQLSWTRGNHNIQFGVNFLRLQYLNNADYPGDMAFSIPFTGLGLGDATLGLVNSVAAKSVLVQGGVEHSIFGFMQDDWRVSAKMTLNLGLRYELPFQWYQPNGYSSVFAAGRQSIVFPNATGGLLFPGDPGVLRSLIPTDFNGVAPRFGFAYDTFGNGKFVMRGGFGIFFDNINANVIGVGEPFYYQFLENDPPGGASAPLAGLGPGGTTLVIPNGFNKANPQFVAPYTLYYPDRNFRTPYYEAFNLGFQYAIARGGVLNVNYVGKNGRKQTIPYDQNPAIYDCSGGYYQVDPVKYCTGASSSSASTKARLRYTPFLNGGTGLVDLASAGSSSYNGLQAQYTQRGGRKLTLLASYTYSKSIDEVTNSQTISNQIPNVFNLNSDRGLSDYDARHIFNLGWVLAPVRITGGSFLTRAVLNNWTYAGKFLTHSGRPFSVTLNNDTALDGEGPQRAEVIPGMSPYLPKNRTRVQKVQQWFNPNAFTYPAIGTFSPMERNTFIGPGYIQTDMNIGRQFSLARWREGMRFSVRADAFNVFNTPNLANPAHGFSCNSTSIGFAPTTNPSAPTSFSNFGKSCAGAGDNPSATLGLIQSTFGNNANTSTNGRKVQFNATIFF
jgi:Carboxypeptidase regulatory-like domain/TonB-dependent Receptor Plug Domain